MASQKSNSIAAYRDRLRSQVPQSHADEPEPVEPAALPEVQTQVHSEPKAATHKKPRKSRWDNPYPDAKPFQVSVYLEDEDLELVKSLRLRLHYSREWMVLKKALELLDKETGSN